jgi:recombinational DNA repair protein RecR
MGCCGRPDNRQNKGGGAAEYYKKYAYLSSHQQEQAEKLIGAIGKCVSCDALTMGDPCTICGQPKSTKEEQE